MTHAPDLSDREEPREPTHLECDTCHKFYRRDLITHYVLDSQGHPEVCPGHLIEPREPVVEDTPGKIATDARAIRGHNPDYSTIYEYTPGEIADRIRALIDREKDKRDEEWRAVAARDYEYIKPFSELDATFGKEQRPEAILHEIWKRTPEVEGALREQAGKARVALVEALCFLVENPTIRRALAEALERALGTSEEGK